MFLLPNQPNQAHLCQRWAGKSLNKTFARFLDAAPLKMRQKCWKDTKIKTSVLFYLEAAFFLDYSTWATLGGDLQLWNDLVLFFSSILLKTKNDSSSYFGDCFHRRFLLALTSRCHQHEYLYNELYNEDRKLNCSHCSQILHKYNA